MRIGGTGPDDDAMENDLLKSFDIPIPISRGASVWSGRVVAANAYSSDNFRSGKLYCMKFRYEIG